MGKVINRIPEGSESGGRLGVYRIIKDEPVQRYIIKNEPVPDICVTSKKSAGGMQGEEIDSWLKTGVSTASSRGR